MFVPQQLQEMQKEEHSYLVHMKNDNFYRDNTRPHVNNVIA